MACWPRNPPATTPYVFIEVQFQPDDSLYPRLFAELFLYLRHAPKPRDWRCLVLYPDLDRERIPTGYTNLIALPEVHRVDLSTLSGQDSATPGWDLLRLIVDDTDTAVARATRLIHGRPGGREPAVLNFIGRWVGMMGRPNPAGLSIQPTVR